MVMLVSINENFLSAMAHMGNSDEYSVVVKETLERLVYLLYQVKLKIDVKEVKYKLLTEKKKTLPQQSLAPTKDIFCLYTKCANYQCQYRKKH